MYKMKQSTTRLVPTRCLGQLRLRGAWQRLSMALMSVMLTATAAWAQSAIGSIQYNSTGGYYEIGSADNLNDLAIYVNGSGTYSTGGDEETTGHDCSGLVFKVTGNISFDHNTAWNNASSTETNYTAIGAVIGTAKKYFNGEFDGQGYTIRGIRIYDNDKYVSSYLGIFGITGSDANIHDIRLADTRITGNSDIGGIVGDNSGTITNCHVAADVVIHTIWENISSHGGIAGYNTTGVISKCISSATLTIASKTGCKNYGGIVGRLSAGTVSNNFAIGATIPTVNGHGTICGSKYSSGNTTEYNYYYDCTVDGPPVTSGVGFGRAEDESSFDSTFYDAAVPMSGIASGAWSETEPNVFTIHNADGWDVFCNIIGGGYNLSKKTVKLGTDITVTRMAGVDYKDFCGTFDGNGKTLTLDYTSTINCTAPFCQVKDGCVIENLHVAGTIASTQQYTAGIIGAQYGNVTIRNCRSSVNIQSTMSEHWYVQGYGKHGGFVGKQNNNTNTNLTIEGCVFDGKIVSNGETPTIHCSGFVGEKGSNASITITNSLYTPQADANAVSSGATFVEYWDGTLTNSYYTATLGDAQGKAAHTVTAGANVTLGFSGTATEYGVSGITVYDGNQGLKYGSTYYAGENDAVSMTLGHTDREGYTFVDYTASAGTLDDSVTPSTLTMPASDVTITAVWEPLNKISLTASLIEGLYWTTFYCGDAGYGIDNDENACAYTATFGDDVITLHKLGKVIKKGNAVIIVGEDNSISMTRDDVSAAEYNMPNDLQGVDVPTALTTLTSDGAQTLYMLSNKSNHFGFHQYGGTNVPARKAYITVPSSAGARPFSIVFDDDATAIKAVNGEEFTVNGSVYDLQGRKVENPKNGLYIVNGKKVVIK